MDIYLQGLTMGLAYVAPIGAQNLFVIQFLTALIVVFFDVTLALACFFGIGALMERFPLLANLILLAGSLVVIWIGVGLLRSKATLEGTDSTPKPLGRVIASACVVTWFNPQAAAKSPTIFCSGSTASAVVSSCSTVSNCCGAL